MALLELKNLKTFFATKRGTVKAVNGVSYSLDAGKVLGVVGESGSGKSVSAMSILRLLDGNGYIDSGEILFNGQDLTKLSMNEMYKIRGNEISVAETVIVGGVPQTYTYFSTTEDKIEDYADEYIMNNG